MNTDAIFICWTCFSSSIQYLFENYCEEIFYFQLKDVHFFYIFNGPTPHLNLPKHKEHHEHHSSVVTVYLKSNKFISPLYYL
jgi:hypothetical protein